MQKLFVALVLCSSMIEPLSGQQDTCSMKFGMNFMYLSSWRREMPFVDVMKSSRLWMTQNSVYVSGGQNLFDTGVRDSIPADSDGYPLQLPYRVAGTETTQIVLTQMADMQNGVYPSGQYICLYDGNGTITFSGDASIVSQTQGRIVLNVTPPNAGIQMRIMQSTFGNHIRNIRVLMPGHEATYQTQPFNPAFLSKIAPFKVLRFMWWQYVNNSREMTWGSRRRTSYYTQGSYSSSNPNIPTGTAYELIVQLCHQPNKDAWVCVPHIVDSNYVVQMAQVFKDNLNPSLKIYLEFSNEVWNGIFPVNQWVGANGPRNLNHPQKTASFARRIFTIWAGVFGSEMSTRVVRVAACQLTNPWVGQQMMAYLGPGGADAISPAAYYILQPENYDTLEALSSNATVSDVARMIRSWFPTLAGLFAQHQQLAQ